MIKLDVGTAFPILARRVKYQHPETSEIPQEIGKCLMLLASQKV